MNLLNPGGLLRYYRIVGIIGHGGFGAVYTAHDSHRRDQLIALKETLDPTSVRRFEREFKLLHSRSQKHYGLPEYYDMFEEQGKGYLAMEYIEGSNLQEILGAHNAPLPEDDVVHYGEQLCNTLMYLHKENIIHRDIKPANIRRTPRGQIVLVDFGLVRDIRITTTTTQRAFTHGYAPLEQYSGGTDQRSDIYSLGATLFHLLTNIPPTPAPDRTILSPDDDNISVLLRTHNPNLSEHVIQAIATAMERKKEDRFADVGKMKEALIIKLPPPPPPLLLPPPPEFPIVLKGHTKSVRSVAFSPDGKTLVSSSTDRTVRLWNLSNDTQQATLTGHKDEVRSVAFSLDGSLIASGSCDETIRLWDVASHMERAVLTGHTGRVMSVAFSPDGKLLASGADDDTVRVWNIGSGPQQVAILRGHTSDVRAVAFSPDGKRIASGSDDDTIRIWDIASGIVQATLTSHASKLRCVAFSPDFQWLASGSLDDTVRLWSIADNMQHAVLKGHKHRILCIAFSPDGKLLASGSRDDTIVVWDVASGTQRAVLTEHKNYVRSVAFSPDGKLLASASHDKTIRLRPVPPPK